MQYPFEQKTNMNVMRLTSLWLCSVLLASQAYAQRPSAPDISSKDHCTIPADLAERLKRVPSETQAFGGKLRLVNVFKRQAEVLLDANASDEQLAERLTLEVFPLHGAFWAGYVGDESDLIALSKRLVSNRNKLLCSRVPALLSVDLSEKFNRHAIWLSNQTGKEPAGDWYLAYGSGQVDMGYLTDIGSVVDLARQQLSGDALDAILTHELVHQIHRNRQDSEMGSVLDSIVSEGIASYANCVYAAGRRTPADCIFYTEQEWTWALEHETALKAIAKPLLLSKDIAFVNPFFSRDAKPVAGGPGAISYFLGFRMIESYVRANGKDSWKDILDMPAQEVLRKSNYEF
jgi:hypothetical protein